MNIVSFSGGKDSTAMLLMMLEKEIPVNRVICVDTTKEFPQMYDHIKKVQAMIEPLKIEIVKIDFNYFFSDKEIMRGVNKGKFGYGWTGARGRWCTRLKVDAMNKIVKKIPDAVEFIGIAYDEVKRAEKKYIKEKNVRLPLVEWKITEKQALEYCYSKGLDWDGLYEKMNRVSCWCCPLSRIGSLRTLYNDFPELWKELEEMDKKSWRNFRSDYTVTDLSEKFALEMTKERCATCNSAIVHVAYLGKVYCKRCIDEAIKENEKKEDKIEQLQAENKEYKKTLLSVQSLFDNCYLPREVCAWQAIEQALQGKKGSEK